MAETYDDRYPSLAMHHETVPNACTCGCTEVHRIAYRRTADDMRVELWSDGMVTWAMGLFMRGVGKPRHKYVERANRFALDAIADDVSLYDAEELPSVVRTARKLARQNGWTLETLRKRVRQLHPNKR